MLACSRWLRGGSYASVPRAVYMTLYSGLDTVIVMPYSEDMNTTTQEIEMTTTVETHTVIYGQAAHGGKIHRTNEGDHAWCLSNNGNKPMRSVVASIAHLTDTMWDVRLPAEMDALRAAKINPNNLCSKCASRVANAMKEVAA